MKREEALKQSYNTLVVEEEKVKDNYYHVRIQVHEEFVNDVYNYMDKKIMEAFMAGFNVSAEGYNAEYGTSESMLMSEFENWIKNENN